MYNTIHVIHTAHPSSVYIVVDLKRNAPVRPPPKMLPPGDQSALEDHKHFLKSALVNAK